MKDDFPSKQVGRGALTADELRQDLAACVFEMALDGKPVDVAEQPDKSGQLVVRVHNEWFRLPEDAQRFLDCGEAWQRAAERNPHHRPEEHISIDHYLVEARKFCLGVLQWEPDAFWRMTPQEYGDALAGHYEYHPRSTEQKPQRSVKRRRRNPQSTPRAAARQAFANIKGWETMPPERLRRAVIKELGYVVSIDTVSRARQDHLEANKQT
jgi:Phage tail assembly chaperone protein, TAC